MKNIFKGVSLLLSVLAVSIIASYVVLAWTEPSGTPPSGNVAAPINVGSTAQYKAGGLGVKIGSNITYWITQIGNSLAFKSGNDHDSAATNLVIGSDGKVGIGTTNPTQKLDTAGFVKGRSGLCIGDGATEKCCDSWNACIALGGACKTVGSTCSTGADCCTAYCASGVCAVGGAACKATGTACANNSDCCTSNCVSSVCAATGGSCKAAGMACSTNSDCCTSICTSGVCAAGGGSCKATGATCSTGSDCCTTNCVGSLCVPAGCKVVNTLCSSNSDCCTSNCTGGFCGPAPSACSTNPAGGKRIFVTMQNYTNDQLQTGLNIYGNADSFCRQAASDHNVPNSNNFKALIYSPNDRYTTRDISQVVKGQFYYNGVINQTTGKCEWKLVARDFADFISKDPDGSYLKNPITGSEYGTPMNTRAWTFFRLTGGGYDLINLGNAGFVRCCVTTGGPQCADEPFGAIFHRYSYGGMGTTGCNEYQYWNGYSASRSDTWASGPNYSSPDGNICSPCNAGIKVASPDDRRSLYCVEQ